eukprot:TRINITY_DN9572_c0_g2_i2.p1 TRINITY_DN9572_c0_g2~~TRINITY_DN9572_c0_g2_i2.p1  ORF type:complete len:212 (+),score=78.94 TRINITY_DN9572_c0_g2_i2:176-811(+)
MTEEEILRQRLLTKEVHFKKCFRRYVSLRAAVDAKDAQQCKDTCHELRKELEFWDLSVGKAAIVAECNSKEVAEYSTLLGQIEKSIEDAKGEIGQLKEQLATEKRIRQNKEEYENIARLIHEFPARAETEKELSSLNEEISRLGEEQDALSSKMDMRSKQFYLLLHTVQDLQNSLEAEEEQERVAMEEEAEAEQEEGAIEDTEMGEPASDN